VGQREREREEEDSDERFFESVELGDVAAFDSPAVNKVRGCRGVGVWAWGHGRTGACDGQCARPGMSWRQSFSPSRPLARMRALALSLPLSRTHALSLSLSLVSFSEVILRPRASCAYMCTCVHAHACVRVCVCVCVCTHTHTHTHTRDANLLLRSGLRARKQAATPPNRSSWVGAVTSEWTSVEGKIKSMSLEEKVAALAAAAWPGTLGANGSEVKVVGGGGEKVVGGGGEKGLDCQRKSREMRWKEGRIVGLRGREGGGGGRET
jgi:hypothetical protein